MVKAIGYTRTSTSKQDLSPLAQKSAVEEWAARSGVQVVAWFHDSTCGATPVDQREGLLAALRALSEHGAKHLAVAKRDRLARDVVVAAVIERLADKAGAAVTSADGVGNGDDPAAELLRNMMACFASYERALIRTRIRSALKVKREKHERTGSVPWGFRVGADGRTLEPEPREQAAVALARDLAAQGLSQRTIAAKLTEAGYTTRTGGAVGRSLVQDMLAGKPRQRKPRAPR